MLIMLIIVLIVMLTVGVLIHGWHAQDFCCFLLLFAVEVLHFVLFSVERSDLVGGPRGAEPP